MIAWNVDVTESSFILDPSITNNILSIYISPLKLLYIGFLSLVPKKVLRVGNQVF